MAAYQVRHNNLITLLLLLTS